MAIYEPERVWWNPLSKDERIWVALALIWMLVSFIFMPIYHLVGAQNPPAETYTVSAEDFDKLVKEPFEWRDGDLIPPDRPGIGIELDEEKLEAHRGKLADLFGR